MERRSRKRSQRIDQNYRAEKRGKRAIKAMNSVGRRKLWLKLLIGTVMIPVLVSSLGMLIVLIQGGLCGK